MRLEVEQGVAPALDMRGVELEVQQRVAAALDLRGVKERVTLPLRVGLTVEEEVAKEVPGASWRRRRSTRNSIAAVRGQTRRWEKEQLVWK